MRDAVMCTCTLHVYEVYNNLGELADIFCFQPSVKTPRISGTYDM